MLRHLALIYIFGRAGLMTHCRYGPDDTALTRHLNRIPGRAGRRRSPDALQTRNNVPTP